jgi:hypothetical protein
MVLIQSNQIEKYTDGIIESTAIAIGENDDITSVLEIALTGLLLQPATINSEGVVVTPPFNIVEISIDSQKVYSDGLEVYGRITESDGVYNLSYYVNDGSEVAYSFDTVEIEIQFIYRFSFGSIFPYSQNYKKTFIQLAIPKLFTEELVMVDFLTSTLGKSPSDVNEVKLFVNGVVYTPITSLAPFTVSGAGNKTITWIPANAGFSLTVNHEVIAFYPTLE